MKLSDIRNDYFTYSTRVSEIIRKLNFAGLALLWILSHEETESFFSNKENFIPLRLLVFSMVTEYFHFLFIAKQCVYRSFIAVNFKLIVLLLFSEQEK